VPAGDDWQHEITFDGFRVQAHIIGKTVRLYSRGGSQFSRRYPRLVSVLGELPTRSAIIDGEIVASDAAGMPDFWPLFLRSAKPTDARLGPRSAGPRWQGSAEVVAGTSAGAPADPREPVRLPHSIGFGGFQRRPGAPRGGRTV
jgi:hypothetical protein